MEPSAQFFVSMPTRANKFAARILRPGFFAAMVAVRDYFVVAAEIGRGGTLNFLDEPAGERRRKSDAEPEGSGDSRPTRNKKKGQPGEVGDALRSVYQRAIEEDIPPEMLDLLGKLG